MSAPASAAAARGGSTWPNDPRAPGLSLLAALMIFTRRLSPRLMAVSVVTFATARVLVGDIGPWDLALFVALVMLQPFSEWLIHVGILHWRPRRVFGRTIDFFLSWSHREHHRKPNDETWWFIPVRSGAIGFGLIGVIGALVLRDTGLWLTLVLTATLLGFGYEWTHYLCHSSYRPRSRLYRRIWQHHRWHHFKNEHYWMGVTRHLGDRIFRTNPDVHTVPTSPTCRDILGGDRDDASVEG